MEQVEIFFSSIMNPLSNYFLLPPFFFFLNDLNLELEDLACVCCAAPRFGLSPSYECLTLLCEYRAEMFLSLIWDQEY